jgi:nucleotide-binding universal stress UspA family protein
MCTAAGATFAESSRRAFMLFAGSHRAPARSIAMGLSHLVVAVDGSEPSLRATAFALVLAAREHARVTFCSVVDPIGAYAASAELAPFSAPMVAMLEQDAHRFCDGAVVTAERCNVAARSVVLEGTPWTVLDRCVRTEGGDAVVVGTHARRGLARAVLGSVASELVRTVRVPVFVVRDSAAVDRDGPIVVALDSEPPSYAALEVAIGAARTEGCALHLVHAFDAQDESRIPDHIGYDPDVAHRRAMAEVADMMEIFADRVRAAGVAFVSETSEGRPVERVAAAARRENARFIATGTHGRGAVGRFVFGSVAEGLLAESPVPVMTVRG